MTSAGREIANVTGCLQTSTSDGAARVVEVDHAGRVVGQNLEKTTLREEVRLHVRVKVEVVARQVREDGGCEPDPIDTLERQRVRRHLHHSGSTAVSEHLREELLHVWRLGRRARCLAVLSAQAIRHGSQESGFEIRRIEHRGQEISGCRLAIGPGDTNHAHASAGMVVERVSQERQRESRVVDREPRRGLTGWSCHFGDDQSGATGDGLRHEVGAVGLQTLERDEHGPSTTRRES